jgi:hypothetical protein
MTLKERRDIFWNYQMSPCEKKVLKNAKVRMPEQLLPIPIVGLLKLRGFGFLHTVDLLRGLFVYYEKTDETEENEVYEEPEEDEFSPTDSELLELFQNAYSDEKLDDKTEEMILIDEILFANGYVDEKQKSKLTVKEILNLKASEHIDLWCLMEQIQTAYYRNYSSPKCKFDTLEDLKKNSGLLFEKMKQ